MTTELATTQPAIEPLIYTVTKETIEETAAKYMTLRITGVSDATGLAEVRQAKSLTVKARTTIEAERKAAKEPYKKAGEMIDARAKELTALLAPVEKHLVNEITRIEAEQAKIKEAELDARLKERTARLNEIGGARDTGRVRLMSESEFSLFLMDVAESNRIRKEQEVSAQAERDRLEAERQRMAEENRKLEEERRKFAAEREQQEQEFRARESQLQSEREQAAKAERERQQAEQQKRAEEERLRQEEAERQRQIAIAPDVEKIAYFAAQSRLIRVPELSPSATAAQRRLESLVDLFANAIVQVGESL